MAPTAHALVAHVLRRLTFGPTPTLVDRFAAGASSPDAAAGAAIDWALGASPQGIKPETVNKDDWDPNLRGFVENLRHPEAGVHEKMAWFWHGHFATSAGKVGNQMVMHGQRKILREHALGNFRTLFKAVVQDPAMLQYLDAAGSDVNAPNENLAREAMELFALGRGQYTEADVKAGALALAGWNVDYETGAVTFNKDASLGGEVLFLGKRGRFGIEQVVDILCDHGACAPYVSGKLYHYLIGVKPTPERQKQLAEVFRSNNLEIKPLVEEIVRGEDFLSARMKRPRFAIEWWTAALHAIGEFRDGEDQDVYPWSLEQFDQLPYQPPNVAGWSPGIKWLSSSQQVTRAAYTWGVTWRMRPIEPLRGTDMVDATLRRCSMFEVSPATKATLQQAALATAGAADELSVSRRLITTALCSPEFALA
jgi:uncharacterized protein (DUF1800 family)